VSDFGGNRLVLDPAPTNAGTDAVDGAITVANPATIPATPILKSITLSVAHVTLTVGQTQSFTAVGTYSDGSTKNITSIVSWVGFYPTAVTISTSGTAKGVALGHGTIAAFVGNVYALAIVTVTGSASQVNSSSPHASAIPMPLHPAHMPIAAERHLQSDINFRPKFVSNEMTHGAADSTSDWFELMVNVLMAPEKARSTTVV
jgi:hypothetical protein